MSSTVCDLWLKSLCKLGYFYFSDGCLLSTSLFRFPPSTNLALLCNWGCGGSARAPSLAAERVLNTEIGWRFSQVMALSELWELAGIAIPVRNG